MASSTSSLRSTNYIGSLEQAAYSSSIGQSLCGNFDVLNNNADDVISVSAFDANPSGNHSSNTQRMQELYAKKAEQQEKRNSLQQAYTNQQTDINDRKEKIIQEQTSDSKENKENKDNYDTLKAKYDQVNAEKSAAASNLTAAQQKTTQVDTNISSKANEISKTTSDLNAARSALESARAAQAKSSSSDNDNENRDSQGGDGGDVAAKEAEVNRLEAALQTQQNQASQLQREKEQLAVEVQEKQNAVETLENSLREIESQMRTCEDKMAPEGSKLQKTIDEDQELSTLKKSQEQTLKQINDIDSDLEEIENQIQEEERDNADLQALRSDDAHNQLESAAQQAGCINIDTVTKVQESAAQSKYNKPYASLSDEERIAVEADIDGQVTLEVMKKAQNILESDPDNEAALAVIAKADQDLYARRNWAELNCKNSIDNLPEELNLRVFSEMEKARASADMQGADSEIASLTAVSEYIKNALEGSEISETDKSALRETLTASETYAAALQQADAGYEIREHVTQILLDDTKKDNNNSEVSSLYEDRTHAANELKELTRDAQDAQNNLETYKKEYVENYFSQDSDDSRRRNDLNNEYEKAKQQYNEAGDAKSAASYSITDKRHTEEVIEERTHAIERYDAQISSLDKQIDFLSDPDKYLADHNIDKQRLLNDTEKYLKENPSVDPALADLKNLISVDLPQGDSNDKIGNAYNAERDNYYETMEKLRSEKADELKHQRGLIEADKRDQIKRVTSNQAHLALIQDQNSNPGDPSLSEHLEKQIEAVDEALNEKNNAEEALNALTNDPALAEALAKDEKYQSLLRNAEAAQKKKDQKQAEICNYDAQIVAAQADNDFQAAAKQAGFDVDAVTAQAQNEAARDRYGKDYTALTPAEQEIVRAQAVSSSTLQMMETAVGMLNDDPDNAAVQAVLEKGQKNLCAQDGVVFAALLQQTGQLPDDLSNAVNDILIEAQEENQASEDSSSIERAFADKLYSFVHDGSLSAEDKSALQEFMKSTETYKTTLDNVSQGMDKLDAAEGALQRSELAAMKNDMAESLGINTEDIIVFQGTDSADDITVVPRADGSLYVCMGDKIEHYSAEEAKRLLIDGGKGNDNIKVSSQYYCKDAMPIVPEMKRDDRGTYFDTTAAENMTGLHIYGGEGSDDIEGGSGSDIIYGGSGGDRIYGGKGGLDYVVGGEGSDDVDCRDSEGCVVFGGDGQDLIRGSKYGDYIDGGNNSDFIYAGRGDDNVIGGDGDDVIDAGRGYDNVDGGAGSDHIKTRDGGGIYKGGIGDDTIEADWGSDIRIYDEGGKDKYVVKEGKIKVFDFDGYRLDSTDSSNSVSILEFSDKNDITDENADSIDKLVLDSILNPEAEDQSESINAAAQQVSEAHSDNAASAINNALNAGKKTEGVADGTSSVIADVKKRDIDADDGKTKETKTKEKQELDQDHKEFASKSKRRQAYMTLAQSCFDIQKNEYGKAAHKGLDAISTLASSNLSKAASKVWSSFEDISGLVQAGAADNYAEFLDNAGSTCGDFNASVETIEKMYTNSTLSYLDKEKLREIPGLLDKIDDETLQSIKTIDDITEKLDEKTIESIPGLKGMLEGYDSLQTLTEFAGKVDKVGSVLSLIKDTIDISNSLEAGDRADYIKNGFSFIASSGAVIGFAHPAAGALVAAVGELGSATADTVYEWEGWDVTESQDLDNEFNRWNLTRSSSEEYKRNEFM